MPLDASTQIFASVTIYLAREELLEHMREQRIGKEARERYDATKSHKVADNKFRA